MKPIPAIVETAQIDLERSVRAILVALASERDAENTAKRHEQLCTAAREVTRMRRLEIGRELLKARGAWPKSGPNARGWGGFLAQVGLDDSTAWRYMCEAKDAPLVNGRPVLPEHMPAHVYFVGSEHYTRVLKIGSTRNIGKRLAELQIGSPVPLRVVGWVEHGGQELEQALHRSFDHVRSHGEWFAVAIGEVARELERLGGSIREGQP